MMLCIRLVAVGLASGLFQVFRILMSHEPCLRVRRQILGARASASELLIN